MLPSRGCQYGGSFLLLLAVETSMAPASATKIRLNDDSGWFCMSTSGAGEKCFRVVRPEADFVTHRDCALDICPSLDNGEASTTLGCISSEAEQAFLEEEIVEGGYMGDGTSSRYSTVHTCSGPMATSGQNMAPPTGLAAAVAISRTGTTGGTAGARPKCAGA